jgi:hypothetical protein
MTPLLVLLVLAVIGLLVYAFAANPKASEVGRLVFACAFLALCLDAAHGLAVLR